MIDGKSAAFPRILAAYECSVNGMFLFALKKSTGRIVKMK
jgi:hypothetical protein